MSVTVDVRDIRWDCLIRESGFYDRDEEKRPKNVDEILKPWHAFDIKNSYFIGFECEEDAIFFRLKWSK